MTVNKVNSSVLKLVILIIGTFLFDMIFWSEKAGLNLFLFTTIAITTAVLLNRESIKSVPCLISMGMNLITGIGVITNNDGMAIFMHIVSFIITIGFIHQPELKAVFNAIPTAMVNFLMFPVTAFEESKSLGIYKPTAGKFFRVAKLILIPAFVVIIFFAIFLQVNPLFAQAAEGFLSVVNAVFDALAKFFGEYPIQRFLFIFFGLLLCMAIIYNRGITFFKDFEDGASEEVQSEPGKYSVANLVKMAGFPNMINLKNQYTTGIIVVLSVNILTLLFNIADISYLWTGFYASEITDLKQLVHEGTYLLIYSILLSIGIILYYFKGSINFLPDNKWLKTLSYIWIGQNMLMVFNVGLRNYYYITLTHSIAYKRVGLVIFLTLTFIGLIFLLQKVRERKSFFSLARKNAWAFYIVLCISVLPDWDIIMTRYNLSNPDKNKIDYTFLLEMSDGTLPLLFENRELFNRPIKQRYRYVYPENNLPNGLELLDERRREFLAEQEEYSILSWNYSDSRAENYFLNEYEQK